MSQNAVLTALYPVLELTVMLSLSYQGLVQEFSQLFHLTFSWSLNGAGLSLIQLQRHHP